MDEKTRDELTIKMIGWVLMGQGDAIEGAINTRNKTFDSEEEAKCIGYIAGVKNCIQDMNDYIQDKELREKSEASVEEWFDSWEYGEDYDEDLDEEGDY